MAECGWWMHPAMFTPFNLRQQCFSSRNHQTNEHKRPTGILLLSFGPCSSMSTSVTQSHHCIIFFLFGPCKSMNIFHSSPTKSRLGRLSAFSFFSHVEVPQSPYCLGHLHRGVIVLISKANKKLRQKQILQVPRFIWFESVGPLCFGFAIIT